MAPSAKRLGQSVQKLASSAVAMIPAGNAGLAVKIAIGLVLSIWWTSGPGAQEERCADAVCVCARRTCMDCARLPG